MAELDHVAEEYLQGWREAAAFCAGRAAAQGNLHARKAYWDAYTDLNRQADELQAAIIAAQEVP